MDELKPCPFCGGKAEIIKCLRRGISITYTVSCGAGGCMANISYCPSEDAAQAIEAYLCNQCDHDTDRDHECIACPHLDGAKILKSVPAVNRWISVEDELPDALQNVIVCTDINTITIAWINGEGWTFADTGGGHTESWSFDDVKYWMPLPEPPKEDET